MDFSVDVQKYGDALKQFGQQLENAYKLADTIKLESTSYDHIYVIGMGGSGIAGQVLSLLVQTPVTIVSDFTIPKAVTKHSLVFVCSYSGNTDETIDSLRQIMRIKPTVIAFTTGGKVEQLAGMYDIPLVKVQAGLQPRQAIGLFLIPMLKILTTAGLYSLTRADVNALSAMVSKDSYATQAEQLAIKIGQRFPIIYASSRLYPVAYRWKTQFNENAKMHAFANVCPELDHNEICGYQNQHDEFFTIMLKDEKDDLRVKKRLDALKDGIKKSGNDAMEIMIKGDSELQKVISAIYLGDWTAYYVAIMRGVDPTPVDIIENFKKQVK